MADQEQLQPGNDGAPSAGESSTGSSRSFPGLGHVRCYWAIMDAMMNFRYLDPILQEHMQEVSLSPRRAPVFQLAAWKGTQEVWHPLASDDVIACFDVLELSTLAVLLSETASCEIQPC